MEALQALATKRGLKLPADIQHPDFVSTLNVLTPAQMRRLVEYREKAAVYKRKHPDQAQQTLICDLEQNAHSTSAMGVGVIPTMVTHGLVWVEQGDRAGRCVTKSERFACQGIDAWGHSPYKVPFDVAQLSDQEVKKLTGNAFHVQAWTSFVLYVLANTGRV
eukprot:825216-Amphidinium_carterae.4